MLEKVLYLRTMQSRYRHTGGHTDRKVISIAQRLLRNARQKSFKSFKVER